MGPTYQTYKFAQQSMKGQNVQNRLVQFVIPFWWCMSPLPNLQVCSVGPKNIKLLTKQSVFFLMVGKILIYFALKQGLRNTLFEKNLVGHAIPIKLIGLVDKNLKITFFPEKGIFSKLKLGFESMTPAKPDVCYRYQKVSLLF